jgi:hypothetical protein
MKMPTGEAIVATINRILEHQTKEAQEQKQIEAIKLLGSFTQRHGVPVQIGAVSSLSRLLRKLDKDAIRQVRSMSDSLLNMDENELEEELYSLRDQLMPIEARIHQVKTKTAFVATVLRPFSPKYRMTWFPERTDIDIKVVTDRIERLERVELRGIEEMTDWAREIADLFDSVVVYRGEDAADLYARPSGTVSEKSSRTYLQAWTAFIERHKEEIWDLAHSPDKSKSISRTSMRSTKPRSPGRAMSIGALDAQELGLDQNVAEDYTESFAMMTAPMESKVRSRGTERSGTSSHMRNSAPRSSRANNWVEIFIESKVDSSAQATRRWESSADFRRSIQKWLDTLPVIWGPAADQFVAKVSVKNSTGQSDLTVPSLTVEDAAKRLVQAVEMQQE